MLLRISLLTSFILFLLAVLLLQVKKVSFVNSKDLSLELKIEEELTKNQFVIYPFIPDLFQNNIKDLEYTFSFPNTLLISYKLVPVIAQFEDYALLENATLQKKINIGYNKPKLKLENNQISVEDFIKTYLVFHNFFSKINKTLVYYHVLSDKTIEIKTSDRLIIKFRQDFYEKKLNSLHKILKQYDRLALLDFRYRSGVAIKFDYE